MIVLDYKDRRPIYEQIVDKISELILNGVLKPDEKMPSVRNLAMELSINPNTIQRAYGELERRGFLYSVKGKGNFVSDNKELLEIRQIEIIKDLSRQIQQAKEYRIQKEEICEMVNQIYGGGQDNDRNS
ncbi:MAG: GntR family transcriptional regulator [Lachnospiraceae bacterium]|nr:GntR family transcriptional regulator [Lachnospiraceae bacterium]